MPNWCNNTLTLTHVEPSMIERAKRAFQDDKLLNEFIPVPSELLKGDGWYDYRVNNWGTKWDVGLGQGQINMDKEHTLGVSFFSAWSPPIAAYEKLSDLGFEIEATYYEPGMMFCGYWDNSNDELYQIEGNADWVRENIPTLIDYNEHISEEMENYDEWRTEIETEDDQNA